MRKTDLVEDWLNTVSRSHSNSVNTKINYRRQFQEFLDYINATPSEIMTDYDVMDEKAFKRKYTPLINSFVNLKVQEHYSPSSQLNYLSAVKSFFKYNSLPLSYTPSVNPFVIFHNRDIQKEEIEEIIKNSQPREKAFYSLMVQSGLRPNEICNLKVEDIEKLSDENTPIPCLITIRQEATKGKYHPYFTFAGRESIDYIKQYFKRKNREFTKEAYVFTKDDNESKTDGDLFSHIFRRTVQKLKKQKVLDFKNKKGELTNRNELRLYNLRKYFRNHADAGQDFVNFWMGHSLGIDGHYFSQTDIEAHRSKYAEKAMPNLRIEEKIPSQNEQNIMSLMQENQKLKIRIDDLTKKVEQKNESADKMVKMLAAILEKQANDYIKQFGKREGELLNIATLLDIYNKFPKVELTAEDRKEMKQIDEEVKGNVDRIIDEEFNKAKEGLIKERPSKDKPSNPLIPEDTNEQT